MVSERLGHASVAFTLDTYGHVMPGMQESTAEELDRYLLPEILSTGNVVKGGEFEREPHRSRTCNLLIKRDEPYLLSNTNYSHPISDIRKYGRDLFLTFYLLLSSVAKLVGKMLAKSCLKR